jgi:hypothetical protein
MHINIKIKQQSIAKMSTRMVDWKKEIGKEVRGNYKTLPEHL